MQVVFLARDDEEDDEMHRRVVERLEIDARHGPTEDGDHFFQMVGKRVRDRHARADAGADRLLAGLERFEDFLVLGNRKLLGRDEMADQLDD